MFQRLYTALCVFSVFVFAFGLGMAAVLLNFRFSNASPQPTQSIPKNEQPIGFRPKVQDEPLLDDVTVPSVRTFGEEVDDDLILVSGGANSRTDLNPQGCIAWLMDRSGTVKHFWKPDPKLWAESQAADILVKPVNWHTVGLHVYPNGDLLANCQQSGQSPYGGILVRLDKESRVIWKKDLLSHHWLSVGDGRIFVPALKMMNPPVALGSSQGRLVSQQIASDFVLILDEQGKSLEEISVFNAVIDSGWQGLIWRWKEDEVSTNLNIPDPVHLDDVRVIGRKGVAGVSWIHPNDLLLSFRNLNAIGILDHESRKLKWVASGNFVRQHSPRLFENGVLVFDNLGGDAGSGGTQLVRIDFEKQEPMRAFPLPGIQLPAPCESDRGGHLDMHPKEPRVLMTLTSQGRIWDVDLRTGKVLWEYLLADPPIDGSPAHGKRIYTAKYVEREASQFVADVE